MVRAYAENWLSSGARSSNSETPLNISLGYWRKELHHCLIGLREQVELQASTSFASPVMGLPVSRDKLDELRQTMDEFLPLITL